MQNRRAEQKSAVLYSLVAFIRKYIYLSVVVAFGNGSVEAETGKRSKTHFSPGFSAFSSLLLAGWYLESNKSRS